MSRVQYYRKETPLQRFGDIVNIDGKYSVVGDTGTLIPMPHEPNPGTNASKTITVPSSVTSLMEDPIGFYADKLQWNETLRLELSIDKHAALIQKVSGCAVTAHKNVKRIVYYVSTGSFAAELTGVAKPTELYLAFTSSQRYLLDVELAVVRTWSN